jgi:ribonuclease P protein component
VRNSLKKRGEFDRVFKRGKSVAMPLFVVYAATNSLGENRLGMSVSKKVGNAVVRNRVRRLIRENFRLFFWNANAREKTNAPQGYDFIVIARPPAGELPKEGSFAKVNNTLVKLLGRLGIPAAQLSESA